MSSSTLRLTLTSISIVLALFIFQNGFLLKRQEISAKSSCSDAHTGDNCWMEQQYQRVILILVDALRYDFLQPEKNLKKSEIPPGEWFYRGQMTKIGELVSSGKASIGTLLADPPTTTLQRLKALTTGTLPTFIDAGDNFSPDAAVNEDSFVHQAAILGKNVTLLGDDTWLSLYPGKFAKTAAYDSFDINDLNSVDDKIAPILEEEISSSNSSIIIAHFLGVDHCGHKFGPSHPVMADTLRKMDKIIANTAEKMRKDDLLVVIGDHGMTGTGDHGGESDLEIQAGIMVYSKKMRIALPRRPIHQIDIVPTVSLLMGIPIPFSNLGTVIVEMFPRHLWESAVGMNYEQIKRFAETYATQKNFGELHTHTARDSNTMEEQIDTMSRIQTVLRVAWTQFDDAYIQAGIFSLIEAVAFLMTNTVFTVEWIVFRTGCILLQSALLSDKTDSDGNARTLLLMAMGASCLYSVFQFVQNAFQTQLSLSSLISSKVLGPLLVLLHSISLFSNSFVVYEPKIVRFSLQSLIFLVFFENLRNAPKPRKPYKLGQFWKFLNNSQNNFGLFAIIFVILRLEPVFHKCREEEVECELYWPSRQAASLSKDAQIGRLFISFVTLLVTNYAVFKVFLTRAEREASATMKILYALSWPLLFNVTFHSILLSMNNFVYRANLLAQMILMFSLAAASLAWRERRKEICAHFLLMPIYLLFGDGLIPALVLFVLLSMIVKRIVPEETLPTFVAFLVPFGFYFVGHSPSIASIPWHAAFVGIPGGAALRILPALFVLLHLNFSAISSIFVVSKENSSFTKAVILITIRATFSCLAASVHRRHLMVWKIFAPKFIFECILAIFFISSANFLDIFRSFMSRNVFERPKTQ